LFLRSSEVIRVTDAAPTATVVRPLRIVVISETDTRDVRLAKQLHALATLGHEVHLFSPEDRTGAFVRTFGVFATLPGVVHGMTIPADEEHAEEAPAPGVPWRPRHLIPVPIRRILGSGVSRMRRRVRTIRHDRALRRTARAAGMLRPDLVMLHRTRPAVAILGRRSTRRALRAPVVVDLHELPRYLHGARFAPSTRALVQRQQRRLVAALRRARVVTSEELIVRHLSAEFGLTVAELPSVMRSQGEDDAVSRPPARDDGRPQGPSLRQRLGLGPEQRLIVYLGFHRPSRGIERLIASVAHLPDHYHLALVVGWTGRHLRRLALESVAADRIHLSDLFPQDELAAALRGSDLGVFVPDAPQTPHEHLCMPTKLYELHAAGVPVLVADDLGLREFAERYGGAVLLERPVSPEVVARAVEDVIEGRLKPSPRRDTPDLTDVMQQVLVAAGLTPTGAHLTSLLEGAARSE
jgi:glycosyltransferase involved in cell wall biosynthesis